MSTDVKSYLCLVFNNLFIALLDIRNYLKVKQLCLVFDYVTVIISFSFMSIS